MALHRTALATALAATLILLTGCDNLAWRRLDYDHTEAVKISRITVRAGGAGDITVRASGSAAQVRIKRVLRYQGSQPTGRYKINGDELVLPTECGSRCTVSYEVTAPAGVAVRGETSSGNVHLRDVGAVDFTLSAGNLSVAGASGEVRATTKSGDIKVTDAAGAVRLHASSGNVEARRLRGGVDAETRSGDITVELDTAASARLRANSGNVTLTVPDGRYQVRATTEAGDTDLGVPNDPGAAVVLDLAADSGDVRLRRR
jgi:hypothetical protein